MADNAMATSWQGNGACPGQQNHRNFDNMKKDNAAWRDILPAHGAGGHQRRSLPHDGEEKG